MHFVKETTTSTRRRFRFVYSTASHTALRFKMGFSLTELLRYEKMHVLRAYNVGKLFDDAPDGCVIYQKSHSHCRGHRFESGMLHHKSCISMQDFLFYTPVSASLLRENCRFVNDVNVLTTILTTIQRKTSIFSMTSRFVSIVECA